LLLTDLIFFNKMMFMKTHFDQDFQKCSFSDTTVSLPDTLEIQLICVKIIIYCKILKYEVGTLVARMQM